MSKDIPIPSSPPKVVRRLSWSLTDDQVREIRKKYNHSLGGYSQLDLAEEYGVGQMTISNLLHGITYSHVEQEPSPNE
jgi:transcriptional regulator with XRE-family HTH domain